MPSDSGLFKESTDKNYCRILSNARCLSEGVDVPSLDAVMFLNPRKSMVDIVQSVGRIMRKAEGKEYGYVKTGDAIVAIHGMLEARSGATNMLKVLTVP